MENLMTTKPNPTKKPVRKAAPSPVLVSVILVREHEHEGERKPAGAQISVHPVTAQWLSDQGVISNSQKD